MDRDIPSFNRPIMQRIQAKNHELHLKRLKNIKSSISSTKPYQRPTYANISNPLVDPYKRKYPNLKKDMIEETKNAEIQRENALLFKKMVRIMKRPDRNNDPMNRTSVTMNAGKNRLSMEFSRINEQNRALFHRLEQQRPTIDVRKLQEQRVKNLNILKFLGKYPNQQAQSYSNNTEQSRQKKTLSSTRNWQYYRNNYRNNSYEGEQQQFYEEERFRQEIEGYDREVNRIRNQMGNVRTMNQFYNIGNINKGQIIGNSNGNRNGNNSHGNNRTINPLYPSEATTINRSHQGTDHHLQQPTIPDRKKFLSQGSTRRTMYQNKFIINPSDNLNDDNKVGFLNNNQKDAQPYPYYLNHPSHNLALQEMNRHSIQMQSNMMEYVAKEIKPHTAQVRRNYKDSSNNSRDNVNGNNRNELINPTAIANTHNSSVGKNIPQRKLNTKNSNTNITTKVNYNIQAQQSPVQQQSQPNPNLVYNHNPHNIPSHPISTNNRTNLIKLPNPAIRTNEVPEGKQVHTNTTKYLNYNNQQVINSKGLTQNSAYLNANGVVNSTMPNILLYRATISLDTVIVQEQLQELCSDIFQELVTQRSSPQSLKQQIVGNLKRISKQLTMSRTPESYLISLTDTSNRPNPTFKDNINANITDTPAPKLTVLQLLSQKFLSILPLQIPQQQGSLLLQQVDYDYKYFITQMLRVQKDTEEDGMRDKAAVYRLVVGLTDSQPHSVHANNMENAEHPQNTRNRLYDNGSCNENQNNVIDRQQEEMTLKEQDGSMQHQEAVDMGQNQVQIIREGSYNGIDGIAGNRANNKLVLDQPYQNQQNPKTPAQQNNPGINQQQHNTSQHPLTNHYQQALEEQIA